MEEGGGRGAWREGGLHTGFNRDVGLFYYGAVFSSWLRMQ
jgi:hypothetical protein